MIALARAEGMVAREVPFLLGAMEQATEILLTGTSAEVLPVVRVDGRVVGDGRPGPAAAGCLSGPRRCRVRPGSGAAPQR
jgi:branched-chain amino acid aminotransferase